MSIFPGMALTENSLSGVTSAGSTTIALNMPIMFGAKNDITHSLWAAALPSSSVGRSTPSATSVDFLSTANLTGVEVVDSRGTPVNTFSIVAGSGTLYDRKGVVIVAAAGPVEGVREPASLPLLVMSFIGALAFRLKS